jgi:hypothetical protein
VNFTFVFDIYNLLVRYTWITEYQNGSPALQQSLGRLLGVLDYKKYPTGLKNAVDCLLSSVDPSVALFFYAWKV